MSRSTESSESEPERRGEKISAEKMSETQTSLLLQPQFWDPKSQGQQRQPILPPLRTLNEEAIPSHPSQLPTLEPTSSFTRPLSGSFAQHSDSSRQIGVNRLQSFTQAPSPHRHIEHEARAVGSSKSIYDPTRTQTYADTPIQQSKAWYDPVSSGHHHESEERARADVQTEKSRWQPPKHQLVDNPEHDISSNLSTQSKGSTSTVLQEVSFQTHSPNLSLEIRQQPRAARACGFGERDRRVIDPPPILELKNSQSSTHADHVNSLRNTFTVVHASIWDETGTMDLTTFVQPGRRTGTRLMGTLVSSSFVAYDENDQAGVFFAFPDLSCRTYGKHRLRFTLLQIDPTRDLRDSQQPALAQVMSDIFTVYSAKDFPGMLSSSALTRALRQQGHAIPVKKGKQANSPTHSRTDADDEED